MDDRSTFDDKLAETIVNLKMVIARQKVKLDLYKQKIASEKKVLEKKKREEAEMKAKISKIKEEQQKFMELINKQNETNQQLESLVDFHTHRGSELASEDAKQEEKLKEVKKLLDHVEEKAKKLEETKAAYASRQCMIEYAQLSEQYIEAENNFKALQEKLQELEQVRFKLVCMTQMQSIMESERQKEEVQEPGFISELIENDLQRGQEDEEEANGKKLQEDKDSTEQPALINDLNNTATATMPNKPTLVPEQIMELNIPTFNNITTDELSPFVSDISKQKIIKNVDINVDPELYSTSEFYHNIKCTRDGGFKRRHELSIQSDDIIPKVVSNSSEKTESFEVMNNDQERRIAVSSAKRNPTLDITNTTLKEFPQFMSPSPIIEHQNKRTKMMSPPCSNAIDMEMHENSSTKLLDSPYGENSIEKQSDLEIIYEDIKTTSDKDAEQISYKDVVNKTKAIIQSIDVTEKYLGTEENMKEQLELEQRMKELFECQYEAWLQSKTASESKETQHTSQEDMQEQETTLARSSLGNHQIDAETTSAKLHEDIVKQPMSINDLNNTVNATMSNKLSFVNEKTMELNIPIIQIVTADVSEQKDTGNVSTDTEHVIQSVPQCFQNVKSNRKCSDVGFSVMSPFIVTEQQSARMNIALPQDYGAMSCTAMEVEKHQNKVTKVIDIASNADSSTENDFGTRVIRDDATITSKERREEQGSRTDSATVINSVIPSGKSIPDLSSLPTFPKEPRQPSRYFMDHYSLANKDGKMQKHDEQLHKNSAENIVIPSENIQAHVPHQITCSTITAECEKPAEEIVQTVAVPSNEAEIFAERNMTFLPGSNTVSISATPQLSKDLSNPVTCANVSSAERTDCITSMDGSFKKMSINDFLSFAKKLQIGITASDMINLQNYMTPDSTAQTEIKNAIEFQTQEKNSADVECSFPEISPVSFPTASGSPNDLVNASELKQDQFDAQKDTEFHPYFADQFNIPCFDFLQASDSSQNFSTQSPMMELTNVSQETEQSGLHLNDKAQLHIDSEICSPLDFDKCMKSVSGIPSPPYKIPSRRMFDSSSLAAKSTVEKNPSLAFPESAKDIMKMGVFSSSLVNPLVKEPMKPYDKLESPGHGSSSFANQAPNNLDASPLNFDANAKNIWASGFKFNFSTASGIPKGKIEEASNKSTKSPSFQPNKDTEGNNFSYHPLF